MTLTTGCILLCAITQVALFDDGTQATDALEAALRAEDFEVRRFAADAAERMVRSDAGAWAVADGRSAPEPVARATIDWIRGGRPALVIGAPLAQPRPPAVAGTAVPLARSVKWGFWHGDRTKGNGTWTQTGDVTRFEFPVVADWGVFGTGLGSPLLNREADALTFLVRSDLPDSDLQVEIRMQDGTRWFATVEAGRAWSRKSLGAQDFSGKAGRDKLDFHRLAYVGFALSRERTLRMLERPGVAFEVKDFGSAASPELVKFRPLPLQDALAPAWKFGETPVAFSPVPRHDGAGAFRGSPWRLRRASEGEWIFLERREGRPEVAFAASGWKDPSRLHAPASLAWDAKALAELVRRPVLFAAGTRHMAYRPGERIELGAEWRKGRGSARIDMRIARPDGGEAWSGSCMADGSGQWKDVWTAPSEPGAYWFTATLGTDAVSHAFTVMGGAADPKDAFVTVTNGHFACGGKRWNPLGINYVPLCCSGLNPEDYRDAWLDDPYYDAATVEDDLAQFRALGGNLVAVQAPWREYWRNFVDFLRLVRKHDLKACVFVREITPLDFRVSEWESYARDAAFADNAVIFAYDIAWEVGFKVFPPAMRNVPRRRTDWAKWIDEEYGSLDAAERDWGFKVCRTADGEIAAPPEKYLIEDGEWNGMTAAYRRFMDDWTSRRWNRARALIRKEDPNHLITYRQGNTVPHDFTFTGPVRHLDFIAPEGYMVSNDAHGEDVIAWVTRFASAASGGKPVLWMEFSHNAWRKTRGETDPVELERAGAYAERFYRAGLASGAVGMIPWWWPGGFRYTECSDYGMIGPAREERPLAQTFRRSVGTYGPRMTSPEPTEWMTFDRDGHAGGYWRGALCEGAERWRQVSAKGGVLGIRLAGEGTDSATCEKRFLRGEFDSLETEPIPGGLRVRARLGNTGMAKWLPAAAGEGGVSLVLSGGDGREFARLPVEREVLRFGETGPLEATVKVPASAGATIRFRLQAQGRGEFGEIRFSKR